MNPKVDVFLSDVSKWKQEIEQLRRILLDCQLEEEFKWKQPCYTFKGSNVVLIGNFKDYCVLSFFKGVLLEDTANLLVAPGENSQSTRMIKFKDLDEILVNEAVLKTYIFQAIEIEKAGLKVENKGNQGLEFAQELLSKFEEYPDFKAAFESLTPGRQRGYCLFFNAAKQSSTRVARIEKYFQQILDGKGINDCTCGLSKKYPLCDGSHKNIR
ncbi:DUF1801 domain-containing protein [Flavobacterium sp. UMI-01]|uniref:DUF1801 domain-containing protein n=1 Tax=Flavobacterium sp. UMI-01 TaxID=1441053 RepID=UPI001C7D99F1|nr:DUF1801 domain-containing protein [Flavobacterium sp. UMI-01]GIZ10093.1 hypothetical protein FUMI01_28190 [Flavobacterium sp. UMI-01]